GGGELGGAMTYAQCLLLDLVVLTVCGLVLLRSGRLSHSHPATVYLLFHVFTFTWRLYSLMNGAPPLFSVLGQSYRPVTEDEIIRAAVLADGSLIAIALACLIVARKKNTEIEESFDVA